jgi:hypothetical protein
MGGVLSCFGGSVASILRRGIHIRRGTRRPSACSIKLTARAIASLNLTGLLS